MENEQIQPGMMVLSADGLAVGRVRTVDADGATLSGHGMLHGDHHIDIASVAGIFDGEVYLRLRAGELADAPSEQPSQFGL